MNLSLGADDGAAIKRGLDCRNATNRIDAVLASGVLR